MTRLLRGALVATLNRRGLVTLGCVVLLSALSWWWLWHTGSAMPSSDMAGMDMSMPMGHSEPAWSADYIGAATLMWAIMMVAMMLPSAAPMILLFDVFSRKNGFGAAAPAVFVSAYLALWSAFALLAAVSQAALVDAGLIDAANLALGSARLSALLLFAAALYELSLLKRRCLSQCQSPAFYLAQHWRPGTFGAVRLGLRHGAYCVGCCAGVMLLLFVGGVMNLAWVAILAVVVLAEKSAPAAWHADRALAGVLLAAALGLLWLGR